MNRAEKLTIILLLFWKILCLVLLQVPKCFGLVRIFCARQKDLHIVAVTNILCQTKRWMAFSKISFWRGTKCSQIFGLAQNIWTSTKHFGTCKRTRHKTPQFFSEIIWPLDVVHSYRNFWDITVFCFEIFFGSRIDQIFYHTACNYKTKIVQKRLHRLNFTV